MQLKNGIGFFFSLQWLVYGICVIDGICIAQGLSFLGTTLGNLSRSVFAILAGRFFLIWHTWGAQQVAADPRTVCTVPVPGNAHHMAASVAGQSATL